MHTTAGLGQRYPCRSQALRMKLMSNPALCATSTAPLMNSRNAGNTASSRGAAYTIASVIPVSATTSGGMPRPGSTSVANSPTTSPPRTFTAPNSVIVSSSLTPVVSRSNTTKVVARNGVPSSSNASCAARFRHDPAS